MFCKFCGEKLDDNAAFCSKCGAKLSAPEESVEITQLSESNTLEENVVEATPLNASNQTTRPPKKISEKTEKVISKCLFGGAIAGAVGVLGFLLIVIIGVAVYGRIYLFDGYGFTKVLSIICIILMMIGFCSVIAKAILSLVFKIGKFPATLIKKILLIGLAMICLSFSIWGFVEAAKSNNSEHSSSEGNKLRAAYNSVYAQYGYSSCYSIGSDDSYISVDTNPYNIDDYYSASNMRILMAMNNALGLPNYVYQSMISTSAMMGKQSATANGITVSWTYHPDRGLEAIYILS